MTTEELQIAIQAMKRDLELIQHDINEYKSIQASAIAASRTIESDETDMISLAVRPLASVSASLFMRECSCGTDGECSCESRQFH